MTHAAEPAVAGGDKLVFEDYLAGEVFTSQRRTLTEADVVMFSMFTGDWQRETDDDGTWLVPQMFVFTLGLCLLLTAGRYAWMPRSFIAFYGFDEISLAARVRIGTTIWSRVTVLDLIERDADRGLVLFLHETLDHGGTLLCSSRHRVLMGRQSEGERELGA